MPTRAEARQLAHGLLAELGDRWLHVQKVAKQADRVSAGLPEDDRELVVVAAWWHDLGYAPQLTQTGLHQLDGARYLTDQGYPERLCALVAHHSAATFEAEERGMAGALGEWPREESAVADALWTADMTTGPRGESLEYKDRLEEILLRYTADSVVARAMMRARPEIKAAISRTRARLAG
jgi:HD superfamily phosphodiesterase